MKQKYHDLLAKLEPYIICHPDTLKNTDLTYLERSIKEEHIYNPLHSKDAHFIERIINLDQLSFGPGGMGMPRWVLFDCALIPGAIIGFGIRANLLSSLDQKTLKCSGEDFVPLSMYIAIPNADQKSWFGHNLSSLNKIIEENLDGLGLLTKYYALGVLKIDKLIGATQWDSDAIFVHLKLSHMKILSSAVPVHTANNTFCYESSSFYSEEEVFGENRAEEQNLIAFSVNDNSLKEMQENIEAGKEFFLVKKVDTDNYLLRMP